MSAKDDANRAAHRLGKVVVNVLEADRQMKYQWGWIPPWALHELSGVARQYEEAYKRYLEEAS